LGCVGVFGAAVIAWKERLTVKMEDVLSAIEHADGQRRSGKDEIILQGLSAYGTDDSAGKHVCKGISEESGVTDCYLGLDIGSTSTNLVLINKAMKLRHRQKRRFKLTAV
jgi:activator of 2-hydroxyglutaryl-CoA dehydratase